MEIFNNSQKKWLVTGCAGFIGSNLLEYLLQNNQKVVGLDNFSTGFQHNLNEVKEIVGNEKWANFTFIEGDIRHFDNCVKATKNVDIILHQAALGSVPRSIADPITTHDVNVSGFVNMLKAAVDNKVQRFVYASSSSVYGDHPELPKIEKNIGQQLSPYAVGKYCDELYAQVFSKNYGIETIGLRYFNVFGPRQDPNGAYAAVIPLWFKAILKQIPPIINGDGETSRDFCYINNVVQMNILCGISSNPQAINNVYNVAYGEQTTLNQLFYYIRELLYKNNSLQPIYQEFRNGDIRHSLADISKAISLVNYQPQFNIQQGLQQAAKWYKELFKPE